MLLISQGSHIGHAQTSTGSHLVLFCVHIQVDNMFGKKRAWNLCSFLKQSSFFLLLNWISLLPLLILDGHSLPYFVLQMFLAFIYFGFQGDLGLSRSQSTIEKLTTIVVSVCIRLNGFVIINWNFFFFFSLSSPPLAVCQFPSCKKLFFHPNAILICTRWSMHPFLVSILLDFFSISIGNSSFNMFILWLPKRFLKSNTPSWKVNSLFKAKDFVGGELLLLFLLLLYFVRSGQLFRFLSGL